MNTQQFSLMVNEHTLALSNFALKFTKDEDDAKDLLQDTMMKALRYYEKFEEGTNIKGWLFTIMRNTFINNFRRNVKTNKIITQNDEITSPQLMKSASRNESENKFAMGDIQKAIDGLPKSFGVPFVRYVEGYKYEEIAEELGIPLGTVKTRIHEARKQLKRQLQMYKESIN